MLGTLGLLLAPRGALAWMVLLGCGAGPSLLLALSFMGLRAKTQETAAALSVMAQGLGYFVAALGPIVFGIIHDHTGGWTLALLAVVAMTILQGLFGLGAGRNTKF